MSCGPCANPQYRTGMGSPGFGMTGAVGGISMPGMTGMSGSPTLVGQRSLGTFPSSTLAGMGIGPSGSTAYPSAGFRPGPSMPTLQSTGFGAGFGNQMFGGPSMGVGLGATSLGGMNGMSGFGGGPQFGPSFGGLGAGSAYRPPMQSYPFQPSMSSFPGTGLPYPHLMQGTPTSAPSFPNPSPSFPSYPSFPTSSSMPFPMTMPPSSFPSAPPPLMLPAPPMSGGCDPCAALAAPPSFNPCNACDPPTFLPLPAPPAPAKPSVIHIKDDSGPKIAALQAEIRRLERLLAGCKENEAGLRGEIAELQARLEFMGNKENQAAACEAELAKLRDQLLEAQRRLTFLEGQRDEAHKHIGFLENQLKAADDQIAQMGARIKNLEAENAQMRMRLESKTELHSRTNVHETYKVQTFEMAAKLAVIDGTDDGLYNGLPIEVEGEGLYRDLVARGRRPRENVSLSGRPASQTTTTETYKVSSFEMAEKLSKSDGNDNGLYNGLPIEVSGQGLYTDLVRRGVRSNIAVSGGAGGQRVQSVGGGVVTGSTSSGGQTYKVANIEMAAKISKMGGADDGTYKGLPIEVAGMGLFRDLRGRM